MSPKKAPKVKRYTNAGKARKRKLTIVALVAAVIIVAAVAYVLVSQPGSSNNVNPSASPSPTVAPSPTPPPYYDSSAAPLTAPAGEYSANGTRVLFMVQGTDSSGNAFNGNITLQMRDDKPITAGNFVKLVKQGFFDQTTFHRIIAGFMIQGGQNLTASAASIPDEIGNDNRNNVGAISMANAGPNTASSEFFINVANNGQQSSTFDTSYTVFGQVIGGMDIVMKISQVQCQQNPQMPSENSLPVYPQTVVKAVVLS